MMVGMGFNNPSWSWSELESALSDRDRTPQAPRTGRDGRAPGIAVVELGRRRSGWSRKRQPFEAPAGVERAPAGIAVPYAELALPLELLVPRRGIAPRRACHRGRSPRAGGIGGHRSQRLLRCGSFRRGCQRRWACRQCSAVRSRSSASTSTACRWPCCPRRADTIAQFDTGLVPDSHAPDPAGTHLLVLADGPEGYARLARVISQGHLAGEKGAPRFAFGDLADGLAGHAWVLTGCRKGAVPAALVTDGPEAARRELERLVDAFGRDRVLVELWDHGDPPTPPATTRCTNWPHSRRRLRGHQQRALRHSAATQAWQRRSRRSGPGAAWTTRRVAAVGGWCPPALRGRTGQRFRRTRGGRDAAARSAARQRSTCRWWRRTSRRSRVPTDTMVVRSPRWSICASSSTRGGPPVRGAARPCLRGERDGGRGPVLARPGVEDDRSRARADRQA